MSVTSDRGTAIALAVLLALLGPAASAHEGESHGVAPQPGVVTGDETVKLDIPDLELVDRNGQKVKFRSEALGDKIVAIDFVYTTCTTVCPLLSTVFASVQDRLGQRLGKDVWLMSITIDPTRDTPRRLDAYAKNFANGPGWLWLTGQKKSVDKVLIGLDAYTPEYDDHPPMVVIGDARTGVWTRLYGIAAPDDILERLDGFSAARKSGS